MAKRNYWLHRIGYIPRLSFPLLEQGWLSIGWSDFVSDDFIGNVRDKDGWQYLETRMLQCWGGLSRARYQLWRFIVGMKSGDWVIVPSSGEFSIFEIVDDSPISITEFNGTVTDYSGKAYSRNDNGLLAEDDGSAIDLGFLRHVKPVAEHISRYKYANSVLTSRMKIRQAISDISDLEPSIIDAYERAKETRPIDFRSELDTIIPHICKSIQDTLTETKFEKLVKWYFERIGASSVEIPSRNPSDKESFEDIDVTAVFDHLKTIFYIQVKHHSGITAEWAAEQIAKAKEIHEKSGNGDGYTRVYWALTSATDFNDDCKKTALDKGIQLVTGPEFASMLADAGFLNVNSAF